jgi:hypothetical protein
MRRREKRKDRKEYQDKNDINQEKTDTDARAIRFTSFNEIETPIQDPLDIPPMNMFAPIPSDNDGSQEFPEVNNEKMGIRRMHTDMQPNQNTPILIMDNAADISMIGLGFEILFHTGEKTTLWGAMASLEGKTYDIVTVAAVVECPASTQQLIVIINQAAYIPDNDQYESLLHTDQAR